MTALETYIVFELAGTAYGVRSKDVLHVDMLEHITPVPNSTSAVDGVVFSRGQVVPALNLRARFGLPREARTARTRLIFVRHEQRTVAFIVDSAREFRSLPTDAVRPLDDTLTGISGNYLQGVVKTNDRLLLILDIPAVLSCTETENPSRSIPQTASSL